MYKDLLVVADATPAAGRRMEVAADLAARFQAHLTGLYAVSVPDPLAYPMYMEGALMAKALEEATARAEQRAAEAHRAFDDVAGRYGVAAEWRTVHGLPNAVVPLHARYADLTIIGQIDPEQPDTDALPRPEDVALAAGRPVLVVPYVGRFESVGRRAVVAWNASREATRAVNDALPLLAAADVVTVLAINPKHGNKGHGEEPGADIALHLARHGVKAQVEQAVSDELDPGQLLLSRAADLSADLIVMGAYGHSRMRELVLGGMTRTILRSMTAPAFLSH